MSRDECQALVYVSSESGAEEAAEGPKIARQKRTYSWLYKNTFDNPSDAHKWIEDQTIWSAKSSHDTEAGQRVQYRCNRVPYRGEQCAAAMHIIYNSDSTKVNLFIAEDEHNHGQINSQLLQRGLSKATKEAVDRYLEMRVAGSKKILSNLAAEKRTNDAITIPTITQLNNYIHHRPGKSNKNL